MNSGSTYSPGREVARGGMGAILAATDQTLDREVAMKVMLLKDEASSTSRQRFKREALVLARLEHPNIVPIHEMGRNAEGQLFYTMKMVKGRTLQGILTAIRKGDEPTIEHYTLDRLLTIYRKVCDAIAFAHHQRIIHRDLKPENVMVGEFGEVLVMDWGLAKHLDDHQHAKAEAATQAEVEGFTELSDAELAAGAGALTIEGAVMGSPQYMPPEQAEGRLADIGTHSDIYSLGAILYAILTLRHPIEGKKVEEVLAKVISGIITPPSTYNTKSAAAANPAGEIADARKVTGLPHCPDGKVPASLSAVTLRAMALKPEDRYATVAQVMADIEAYQSGFATSAEQAGALRLVRLFLGRHKTLAAVAALVVLLSLGLMAKVISSERKATENALLAEQNARAAQASEHVAKTNEFKAVAAQQEALAEKELTRRALARAQTALADAALRELDGPAARAALLAVPEELRDTSWGYLLARSDPSLATIRSLATVAIRGVAGHPLRPGIFATAGADGWIELVEARTGARVLEFKSPFGGAPGGNYHLSFSPDGEELAVGNQSVTNIAFHSTRDGRKLREWVTPPPFTLEFSPAGGQLLITSTDRSGRTELRMHDAKTGMVKWVFNSRSSWVRGAFHPTGKSVVAIAGPNSVSLLDARDGSEIRALPDSGPFVHALAVSHDGELAAYGDEPGGVRCARLSDGKLMLDFRAASCAIRQLSFTPDHRRLVSLTYPDNRSYNHLRVWDARSGYMLQAVLGLDASPILARVHPLSG